MKIDGRLIAEKILANLKKEVEKLKIKPHLAAILVGKNLVWQVYVGQKKKKAEEIGARVTLKNYESKIKNHELIEVIQKLNRDRSIPGIIVQRPLPAQIDLKKLTFAVDPKKDVDGFHPDSLYPMPVAAAVIEILKEIHRYPARLDPDEVQPRRGWTSFRGWLKDQNIVVIGKGETAGAPTTAALKSLGATPKVIDSQTPNPQLLTKKTDVIISCVGKPNVVKPEMIKKGVILIGVGIHRNPEGKLAGDYNEKEIKDIASFYTPVPGGVGPINVAMLLKNLVAAAKLII